MSRSTLLLTLAVSASLLGACSDSTAPRRSGGDDPAQVGDQRGKNNDPKPHTALIPASNTREAQPADDRGRGKGEAQPADDRGLRKGEAQPADDRARGQAEAQPADDKGRSRGGKDDATNHG